MHTHLNRGYAFLRVAPNRDAFDLLRSVNTHEFVVYRVSPAPENL